MVEYFLLHTLFYRMIKLIVCNVTLQASFAEDLATFRSGVLKCIVPG